jgi:dienelactone hydrolase
MTKAWLRLQKSVHLTSAILAAALLALPMPAAAAEATPPQGAWVGSCDLDGQATFVRLRLERGYGGLTGAALVRSFGIRTPITNVDFAADRLAFSIPLPGGPARLSGELRSGVFAGTVEHSGQEGRFELRQPAKIDVPIADRITGDYQLDANSVAFVSRFSDGGDVMLSEGDRRFEMVPLGAGEFLSEDLRKIEFQFDAEGKAVSVLVTPPGGSPARAPRVHLYDQQQVTFTNGDVRLAATLALPLGPGPHPALVVVHGSGPSTRDSYRVNADLFARGGVACLYYDKRGAGESTGDWRAVDFDVLAEDVLAGVRFMQAQPRVRADKVGLWGVSQAGWIIPLAASQSNDVAFVVPVSGGAVMPAEQEVWRHRQNLLFLGVSERFIEAGRKASVMAYDWQRRNQTGRSPIPNVFADDQLNMYHDAAGVLRQVRQPVLAIFGGLDTLTPPRESAAIWAEALGQRGDDDFSVRLFPQGTHGITIGEKTGSPLEIVRQRRFVSDYYPTMLAWIHHHAGGPEFAAARQVDVEDGEIPVESRGMSEVSWFGSGGVQPWLLAAALVVFTLSVLILPLGYLWRRVRRTNDTRPIASRRSPRVTALWGLLNLGILFSLIYVLRQLVEADPHPLLAWLPTVWNSLVVATWLSLVLTVYLLRTYAAAWRSGCWSLAAKTYHALAAVAAVGWVSFVYYWDLIRPTW